MRSSLASERAAPGPALDLGVVELDVDHEPPGSAVVPAEDGGVHLVLGAAEAAAAGPAEALDEAGLDLGPEDVATGHGRTAGGGGAAEGVGGFVGVEVGAGLVEQGQEDAVLGLDPPGFARLPATFLVALHRPLGGRLLGHPPGEGDDHLVLGERGGGVEDVE